MYQIMTVVRMKFTSRIPRRRSTLGISRILTIWTLSVCQIFRFPLDVDLSPSPTLNTETNSVLFQYLRDVSTDSTFSLSILQVLIDERRQFHRDRHNKGKIGCTLKVGDVVKAHVQVQSRADTGIVSKLAYRARGPFIITKDLGNNSFEVQRYGNADSAIRK